MNDDKLAYFRGWKDSCENTAVLMENIAAWTPEGLEVFSEYFITLANVIRVNGQQAIGLAESVMETKQ